MRAGHDVESGGRRDVWIFAAIAALAFVLRVVAVFQYERGHPNANHPVIDEASYDTWAREIAAGEWLGREVFFQEPLYPYALGALYAFVSPERLAARLAQALLWAVASVFAGLAARRAFGRASGFCAAAFVALYGPGLIFPSLLLKENLFLALFALFAWLLVRTRASDERGRGALAWLALGLLAGAGALLRGNMLVLAPAFVAWPLVRAWLEKRPLARSTKHAACVFVGIVLALAPVALRNRAVGGELVLTTSGAGTNLYGGNNRENPYGRATEFSFIRGIPRFEAGDWRREAERRTGRALTPKETSDFWRGEVLHSVREHPLEHARILWNKLRLTLGRYEVPDNHALAWDARYVTIARLPWPDFGVLGVLGFAGLVAFIVLRVRKTSLAPADARAALELAALFALYLATIVLTVTSDRARLPLVALLAPFAGFEVVRAWSALRARSPGRREWLLHVAVIALAAVAVHWPVFSADERAEDLDKRDFNLAVQLAGDPSRTQDARALAQRLLSKHTGSARLRVLIGELDLRAALTQLASSDTAVRTRAARDIAELRARIDPLADDGRLVPRERSRAELLAGHIALAAGDHIAAERRFSAARAFDPDDRELRRVHARALIALAEESSDARAQRAATAVELLQPLAASTEGPDRAEIELDLAQARFWSVRARLASGTGARDELEAELRSAMKLLQDLGEPADAPRELRIRAREIAGWFQLELGNARASENLFRAALKLGAGDSSKLGLANALAAAVEASPAAEGAAAKLEEARGLASELALKQIGEAPLSALRARISRAEDSRRAH